MAIRPGGLALAALLLLQTGAARAECLWQMPPDARGLADVLAGAASPPCMEFLPGDGLLRSAGAARAAQVVQRPQAPQEPVVPMTSIRFEFDSAAIRPAEEERLRRIAAELADSRIASLPIRLEGHADETGPADYNQALSERRAEAVRRALLSFGGLPPDRLSAVGHGEDRPLPNLPGDHPMQRRVEFRAGTVPIPPRDPLPE